MDNKDKDYAILTCGNILSIDHENNLWVHKPGSNNKRFITIEEAKRFYTNITRNSLKVTNIINRATNLKK